MIKDILYLLLLLAGIIIGIASVVVLLTGKFKKSTNWIKLGLAMLPLSALLIGIFSYDAYVTLPKMHQQNAMRYVGKYLPASDSSSPSNGTSKNYATPMLELRPDMSYSLNDFPQTSTSHDGTWDYSDAFGSIEFLKSDHSTWTADIVSDTNGIFLQVPVADVYYIEFEMVD